MIRGIVQSPRPVTLLGAGEVSHRCVAEALSRAPFLVAADGGANVAIAAGHVPEAVIGDLDSVSPAARAAIPAERIWRIDEQETTDFEKCLSRIEAPYILGLGFTGARLDHALAVWSALVRHPARRCLILGSEDVVFVAPRRVTLDLAAGTRVSLYPMGRVAGRSEGLYWPIEGEAFAPDGRIGTSNRATGPVTLEFDADRMLVMLPRACLGAAIAALAPAGRA
ncbi:thiamine diphosphokinase [Defluviimonas sp. WL0024]|uniref:Thiamine diphosphokinase n=2 Tax=Albidovulum TaxID=205889 RepID=A0ABT3J2K5_9RHOB|nr:MULTISPECIES: thiamine diphosphokinase [Defluviimonas]MCU9847664.1 thiamine diphosphokinase [Defluviimonas sp. WL0024]MCW3781908.1 thiamine diphosphokinase [Defluviimonas salinarum]